MQNPRSDSEGFHKNNLENASESSKEKCPACQSAIVSTQSECFSCGIVFAQYARFQFEKDIRKKIGGLEHLGQHHLQEFDTFWKRLVVNYQDRDLHVEFVDKCQKEMALPFAIHCYSRMLEIDSSDDIAVVMRERALALLKVHFVVAPQKKEVILSPSPLFKWVNNAGILLGVLLMVMAGLNAEFKSLMVLGFGFLLVFLAAKFYQKNYFS